MRTNKKILIIGSTGLIGSAVLAEAVKRYYQITVLVRDATKLKLDTSNLDVIEGDVLDKNTLAAAIKGQDAVIQCLGIGGMGDGKPTYLISTMTKLLVEEMENQRVSRLISVSNYGATGSHSPWYFTGLLIPLLFPKVKAIIQDKNRMEAIIEQSHLKWTTVYFTEVVEKQEPKPLKFSLNGKGVGYKIALSDAASVLLNQLDSQEFIAKSVTYSN